MKIKLLLSSMFYYVNIGILLILLGVGNLVKEYLGIPAFYIVCAEAVIYIGLVLKSFTSKKFQDRFLLKMKQRNIKKLNKKCMVLASEATRYTNAAYYRKLSSLLNDKNEIIKSEYVIDKEIPIFTQDRNFIQKFVDIDKLLGD